MANEQHLAILEQGVEAWNNWRVRSAVVPDLSGAILRRMDLRGINFTETNLCRADLQEAYLNQAQLIKSQLVDAVLEKAECSGTNFNRANLNRVNFSRANLVHAFFMEAHLCEANLFRANLFESDLRQARLDRAKLCEVTLNGANLSGVSLVEASLCRAKLAKASLVNKANLFRAKLIEADLREANLAEANLSEANLSKSDCCRAIFGMALLKKTVFIEANLKIAIMNNVDLAEADLSQAYLDSANLIEANLEGANLSKASLSRSDLERANFRDANLTEANLSRSLAIAANFQKAILTGACLEAWNYERAVLTDTNCKYFYLKFPNQERRPSIGELTPGEFTKLFEKALNTVDLIFNDGIDWKAFFACFQELKAKYCDENLAIQAIERKSGGAFVIRLEVNPEANKVAIETNAKELYETRLKLLEVQYRGELRVKDAEMAIYRQKSADLLEIVKMQATRPINVEKIMSEIYNNDLKGANLGNFANKVADNARQQANQHIYVSEQKQTLAEAAAEIQQLLKQLEQFNPTATQAERITYVNDETTPSFKRRVVGALQAGGETAIEEFLDNPYVNIAKAIIKGWIKPD